MDEMFCERMAISRHPAEAIREEPDQLRRQDKLSPGPVFRDSLVLSFPGLKDACSENDLENAILSGLQEFIAGSGTDFAFLARQKRIVTGGEDHRIDLLLFHRRLRRLVAIELRPGTFKAEYKGQMELGLRRLSKYETLEGEEPPIGHILCAGKSAAYIEFLELDKGDIRVAEYLPGQKLPQALEQARHRLNQQVDPNT
jgi:predicted nuclease of restriction endonuclease-like (RecB) superfamily